MAPATRKLLALDANVPLDLAAKDSGIIAFQAAFSRRGYEFWIAPTALQEIHVLSERGDSRERELALAALKNLIAWGITPFNLKPVGHGLTGRFSEILISRKLLPEGEYNDGMILAETSLADLPVLITSDHDLLDIDPTSLKIAFDDCGLPHVATAHPVRFLKALR